MTLPVLRVAGCTDTGQVRKANEDAFSTLPSCGVFAVADGMGGVAGGAFASRNLMESINAAAQLLGQPAALDVRIAQLREAVSRSNRAIRAWAEDQGVSGSGTTLVALTFDPRRPEFAAVLHAGDSRAYLFREGALQQITRDHSAAESFGDGTEASVPALFRNVVTNAIGMGEDVVVDETLVSLRTGDAVLLCSDGLYRMVEDKELVALLAGASEPDACARRLVEAANRNGGKDNITAVLVFIGDPAGATRSGTTDSETHDTDMRAALEAARASHASEDRGTRSLTSEFAAPQASAPQVPANPVSDSSSRRNGWWALLVVVLLVAATVGGYLLETKPPPEPVTAAPAPATPAPPPVEAPPVRSMDELVTHALATGDWSLPSDRLAEYVESEGKPSLAVVRAWMDVWRSARQDYPGAVREFEAFREAVEAMIRVWNPLFSAPAPAPWPEDPVAGTHAVCLARAGLQAALFDELDGYVSTAALVLGAFGKQPAETERRLLLASRRPAGEPSMTVQLETLRNLVRSLNRWKARTRELPVGLAELQNLTATFLEPVEAGVRGLFVQAGACLGGIPAPADLGAAREEVRRFFARRDSFTAAIEDHAHLNGLEREALAVRLRDLLDSVGLKDVAESSAAGGGAAP